MTAPTTTPPKRPAVLDLPPDKAARTLSLGQPCPVCGATLGAASSSSAQRANLLLALMSDGPGGMIAQAWFDRRTSCECGTCHTTFRGVPIWETKLALLAVALIPGAFLLWIGLREIAGATGGKLGLSVLAILLGVVGAPLYAWVALTRPWARLASKVSRARSRWAEERTAGPIEIDADALLRQVRSGGTCPACEKDKLDGPEPNPLWTRASLGCPTCRVEIPSKLTPLGAIAGYVGAAVFLGVGSYAIWLARDSAGNALALRFVVGIVLVIGGLYAGFLVQSSGDEPARLELERARRAVERRRRGLPSRDEEEEPAIWFQENLEAVVVAFILALVIRHFVMEAFVIPTGSMAPTLLGDHFRVECKNCHYPFAVQKLEGRIDPERGEGVAPRCPLCGIGGDDNKNTFYGPDVFGGNKILVNKFIYKLEQPERYQVVVFKYPRNPSRNFIKRLVGLPEETLKIDGRGDVWVKPKDGDKFALARKSAGVQEELWMPVYDARWPDPRQSAWRPEDAARWESVRGPTGEVWTAKPGPNDSWLSYANPIRDYYGYNSRSWASGTKAVGDVRVRARVTPAAGAKSVQLAVVENERALLAQIPVGTGDTATLGSFSTTGRTIAASARCKPLQPGVAVDLALGYSDERVTLLRDGEVVLTWDDPQAPAWTETSSVRLGADGGGARFENVRVDRDIFYVPAHGSSPQFDPTANEVKVPAECYFMMGDNSPNSQDGREWGFVHQPHLIGRAFLVFWPLNDVKLIR